MVTNQDVPFATIQLPQAALKATATCGGSEISSLMSMSVGVAFFAALFYLAVAKPPGVVKSVLMTFVFGLGGLVALYYATPVINKIFC